MSAIYDVDYNFVTANFSSGAGYPANILKYYPRYHLHSRKTAIKKSFAKAALHKNLQSVNFLSLKQKNECFSHSIDQLKWKFDTFQHGKMMLQWVVVIAGK